MQVVEFLGVILDSVNMTITLPESKINRIRNLITEEGRDIYS